MNWSTFLIATIVAIVFIAIVVTAVRNKKNGKSSCGGNCSGCRANCHH